jgi:flavin-dependent dehydrogenase
VVRPAALRAYLDARLASMHLSTHEEPLEGATLEVDFRGLHFAGGVHLAGDAAGVPSALTAEGIYSALLTGEEVARRIIDPAHHSPRVGRWLRIKRRHDRFAAFLRRPPASAVALPALAWLSGRRMARRPMVDWFIAG